MTKIARNTLFMYVRMGIIMLINLLIVRIILRAMGDVDFGIYTAVGGIVTLFSCISVVLSMSTQRFYSMKEQQRPDVFAVSMNIHVILAGLILLIGAGLWWWLKMKMNIPDERMSSATILFFCSLITFLISILQNPYQAAIIAHEELQWYALISILECLCKLGAALLMLHMAMDKLVSYGWLLMMVAILVWCAYFIAGRRYEECHYVFTKNKNLHRELLQFSAWTLYGSAAGVGMIQANTILTTVFFGPVVTAARGIALQVFAAMNTFCNSFCFALRPAMMDAIAHNDQQTAQRMFHKSNWFIFLSMLLPTIPMAIWMPKILEIWLGEANDQMILYTRLILIYNIILCLNNPITIWIQALGEVKKYHLAVDSIMLLCFPITWGLYAIGLPPEATYWAMIGIALIAHGVRIIILNKVRNQAYE